MQLTSKCGSGGLLQRQVYLKLKGMHTFGLSRLTEAFLSLKVLKTFKLLFLLLVRNSSSRAA